MYIALQVVQSFWRRATGKQQREQNASKQKGLIFSNINQPRLIMKLRGNSR
jgi:hypothetical protein